MKLALSSLSLLTGASLLAGILTGCATLGPANNREAAIASVKETEAAWSRDFATRDMARLSVYYADDASLLIPNEKIATGKDAILASLKPLLADPNFSLNFQSTLVDAAASGDLAYTQGTYTMTMSDPKGKAFTDHGKYLTIYRKQADGSWKAVADTQNSDLPAPSGS